MERSGDGPLPFAAVLLSVASLTEPLVNLAINIINDLGVAGVALLTFSSAVIGLPGTEPTMLFAGFNAYQGHLTMIGIIVAGLIGDIGGASVAYAIGYYGRRDLLERHGSKLHISKKRLDVAHRWFERHGAPAVLRPWNRPDHRQSPAHPFAAPLHRRSTRTARAIRDPSWAGF